jgi:hypothetical protein
MPTDIIVAGLGKSTQKFAAVAHKYVTIGVNDIDKFFSPTHLVVLDPYRRFSPERQKIICETKADHVWTTPEWPCFKNDSRRKKITTVRFDNKQSFNIDKTIPNFRTSPIAGIGLAYKLGAKRIGVVGMDLLADHHMHKYEKVINKQISKLAKLLLQKGVILVNISEIANLYTIPTTPLSYIQEK